MTQTMTKIDRRAMIAASGAALLLPSALGAQSLIGNRPAPFSWERLVAQAQQLTRTPFKETPAHPGAAKVDYIAQHEARERARLALRHAPERRLAVQHAHAEEGLRIVAGPEQGGGR